MQKTDYHAKLREKTQEDYCRMTYGFMEKFVHIAMVHYRDGGINVEFSQKRQPEFDELEKMGAMMASLKFDGERPWVEYQPGSDFYLFHVRLRLPITISGEIVRLVEAGLGEVYRSQLQLIRAYGRFCDHEQLIDAHRVKIDEANHVIANHQKAIDAHFAALEELGYDRDCPPWYVASAGE